MPSQLLHYHYNTHSFRIRAGSASARVGLPPATWSLVQWCILHVCPPHTKPLLLYSTDCQGSNCFLTMLCCVCNPHLFVHYHTPHFGSSAFMGGQLWAFPRGATTQHITLMLAAWSGVTQLRPQPLLASTVARTPFAQQWFHCRQYQYPTVQFFPKVDMVSKPNMGNKLLCPWVPYIKAVATSTTISYPFLKTLYTEHVTNKDETLTEDVHGIHGILNWFPAPLHNSHTWFSIILIDGLVGYAIVPQGHCKVAQ